MDQLLDILNEINSDVDYEVCDTLIDDGIFSRINPESGVKQYVTSFYRISGIFISGSNCILSYT